jgi:hypothetical protein
MPDMDATVDVEPMRVREGGVTNAASSAPDVLKILRVDPKQIAIHTGREGEKLPPPPPP